MPTLPGRAQSILAVLGRFAPSQPGAPTTFDWRSLVEAKKPGRASETQRRQAARVQQALLGLSEWAEARHLPREHIEESAVYAAVCTTSDARPGQTHALALVIYWIYLLDDFLDRRDFADASRFGEIAALNSELAAILRPLHTRGRSRGGRAARAQGLLRRRVWRQGRSMPTPDAKRLACALGDVLRALEDEWSALPRQWGGRRARMALVARELTRCAVAMRTEMRWNAAFACHPDGAALPPMAAYIRNGSVSIGMPAVAAVAASFERRPRFAWWRGREAISAGGGVVRLTNDVHTYFADVEEGKVSAVTLSLRELGFPLRGLDPETSPEERRAQALVAAELARMVEAFGRGQSTLPDGPLAYCARCAVAFALAVYGDGSRHTAEPAAA